MMANECPAPVDHEIAKRAREQLEREIERWRDACARTWDDDQRMRQLARAEIRHRDEIIVTLRSIIDREEE